MKRFLPAVALALLVTACGGGGDVAATVNGVDIAAATIEELIDNGEEDLSDEQFRSILTAVVQWNAIADAARDEYGIDPTEDEVAEYADNLVAQAGGGLSREDFLRSQQVTEAGFVLSADRLLVEERLFTVLEAGVELPTEADAEQALADEPASWTNVCSSHILVGTSEEAGEVTARLEAGEEFADLAVELSLDTGSGAAGGDLGCAVPATYVPEFAEATLTAEIGVVTEPVESTFGFHLIRVDSRIEATIAEVLETLTGVAQVEAVETWFFNAVTTAEITIAEEYGIWSTDPVPTIVAPVS